MLREMLNKIIHYKIQFLGTNLKIYTETMEVYEKIRTMIKKKNIPYYTFTENDNSVKKKIVL